VVAGEVKALAATTKSSLASISQITADLRTGVGELGRDLEAVLRTAVLVQEGADTLNGIAERLSQE
jgi:methyl-accepting chemotaxis protein